MGGSDVVDQLLNQNRLADTCAAEQTDFTTLCIGADQVDNLDTGFQNLGSGLLLLVGGSRTMDGPTLLGDGSLLVVDGLTQQVKHTTQALVTNGNADGGAGVYSLSTSLEAVGGGHSNTTNHIVTDVLSNLSNQNLVAVGDFDCAVQHGKLVVSESNIKDRTHDLDHSTFVFGHWILNSLCWNDGER